MSKETMSRLNFNRGADNIARDPGIGNTFNKYIQAQQHDQARIDSINKENAAMAIQQNQYDAVNKRANAAMAIQQNQYDAVNKRADAQLRLRQAVNKRADAQLRLSQADKSRAEKARTAEGLLLNEVLALNKSKPAVLTEADHQASNKVVQDWLKGDGINAPAAEKKMVIDASNANFTKENMSAQDDPEYGDNIREKVVNSAASPAFKFNLMKQMQPAVTKPVGADKYRQDMIEKHGKDPLEPGNSKFFKNLAKKTQFGIPDKPKYKDKNSRDFFLEALNPYMDQDDLKEETGVAIRLYERIKKKHGGKIKSKEFKEDLQKAITSSGSRANDSTFFDTGLENVANEEYDAQSWLWGE